jgi:hypothetical protein
MKHPLSNLLPALLLAALGLLPHTSLAQPKSSINIGAAGLIGPNLSASSSFLEYERLLSPKMAVLVRAGMADYTYDEESYTENGKPKGIDIGARIYPLADKRAKGFFVGGSLGYWTTDWTWIANRNNATYHKEGEVLQVRSERIWKRAINSVSAQKLSRSCLRSISGTFSAWIPQAPIPIPAANPAKALNEIASSGSTVSFHYP